MQQPVPMQQVPTSQPVTAPNPNYQQPQMAQAPHGTVQQQPQPVPQQQVAPAPAPPVQEPEKPKEVETAELISFD